MTLLTISFTSLSWKDTSNCHRSASIVCWTLLRQVGYTQDRLTATFHPEYSLSISASFSSRSLLSQCLSDHVCASLL